MMNGNLLTIIEQIISQNELPQEVLIDAIESALRTAARKRYGSTRPVSIDIDQNTGEIKIYAPKKVVEIMRNFATEIPIEEAVKQKPDAQVGEFINVETEPSAFGRIEAQTARQIFVQKIREAQRDMVYEEYQTRIDDIVRGVVQRQVHNDIIIELGKTEGILPLEEQVEKEEYMRGDYFQCLIMEVRNTTKEPPIVLSRRAAGLIARLFELEVPEIYDGFVRIMAIARDPGDRSKVAVAATDEDIDAVGTCVGMKGSRVQMVIQELRGEKINILEWNPDPEIFIGNALQPAKVTKVMIIDENENRAQVIVPDDQLSLAIGRKGQNVRLAAKLTGWRMDIKSESESSSELKERITANIFKDVVAGEAEQSDVESEHEETLASLHEASSDADAVPSVLRPSANDSVLQTAEHSESEDDGELSLTELDGVGPKTAEALKAQGFLTVKQIAMATPEELAIVPGIGDTVSQKI
ncbi:MAG: transcription termination/antitermination protein NusA, partial [Deltaproteobacteria bacterium]|nr:transcription termination/antitermination protein NusA [Deltaproteobacteria bacterium]